MYKLQGVIKVVKDTVQVTEKFAKREFVVTTTADMYPQDISFQSAQDKCSMLDGYSEGDTVEVSFNLRGREWISPQSEVKYFNTLDAWRIEKISGTGSGTPTPQQPSEIPTPPETEGDDDLPF